MWKQVMILGVALATTPPCAPAEEASGRPRRYIPRLGAEDGIRFDVRINVNIPRITMGLDTLASHFSADDRKQITRLYESGDEEQAARLVKDRLPLLRKILNGADSDAAQSAAILIGCVATKKNGGIDDLGKMLQKGATEVAISGFSAIRHDQAYAVEMLAACVDRTDDDGRYAIARSLRTFIKGTPLAAEVLNRLVRDPAPDIRLVAAMAFPFNRDNWEPWLDVVAEALPKCSAKARDDAHLFLIAYHCRSIKSDYCEGMSLSYDSANKIDSIVRRMIALAESTDIQERSAAFHSLGVLSHFAGQKTTPVLVKAARQKDDRVSALGALVWQYKKSSIARATIRAGLKDADERVRMTAAYLVSSEEPGSTKEVAILVGIAVKPEQEDNGFMATLYLDMLTNLEKCQTIKPAVEAKMRDTDPAIAAAAGKLYKFLFEKE